MTSKFAETRHAVAEGRESFAPGSASNGLPRAARADSLEQLLDDLDRELGPPTDEAFAWADRALGRA